MSPQKNKGLRRCQRVKTWKCGHENAEKWFCKRAVLGPEISKIIAFRLPGSTAGKDPLEEISVQGNICQNHPFGNHPFANPRKKGISAIFSRQCLKIRKKGCGTPSAIPCQKGIIARYGEGISNNSIGLLRPQTQSWMVDGTCGC